MWQVMGWYPKWSDFLMTMEFRRQSSKGSVISINCIYMCWPLTANGVLCFHFPTRCSVAMTCTGLHFSAHPAATEFLLQLSSFLSITNYIFCFLPDKINYCMTLCWGLHFSAFSFYLWPDLGNLDLSLMPYHPLPDQKQYSKDQELLPVRVLCLGLYIYYTRWLMSFNLRVSLVIWMDLSNFMAIFIIYKNKLGSLH